MKVIEIPESAVAYLSTADATNFDASAPSMVNACVEALLNHVGVRNVPQNHATHPTLSSHSYKDEIGRAIVRMEANKVLLSKPFAARLESNRQSKAALGKSLPPGALKEYAFKIKLEPMFLELKSGEGDYSADEFGNIPDPMLRVMERYSLVVTRSCVKSKLPLACRASIEYSLKNKEEHEGSTAVHSLRGIFLGLSDQGVSTPCVVRIERKLILQFSSCYWTPKPELRNSFEISAENGESFDQFYTRTTGKDPYGNMEEVWLGLHKTYLETGINAEYPLGDNDFSHPLPGHEEFLCFEKAILAAPALSKIFSTLLRKGSYELSAFDFRAGEGFSDVVENIGI